MSLCDKMHQLVLIVSQGRKSSSSRYTYSHSYGKVERTDSVRIIARRAIILIQDVHSGHSCLLEMLWAVLLLAWCPCLPQQQLFGS